MASPTWWTWVWVNSGSWWWTGRLACRDSWGLKESDMTERLNWTEMQVWDFYIYQEEKLKKKKNACSKCFLCKHTKQAVRESTLPGKWVLLIWLLFRLKSYSTLCDPWTIACQTPLSVENQARILEWVATSFSRIFLDQGSNLHLLHWQADSLPLSQLGLPLIKKAACHPHSCHQPWWNKSSLSGSPSLWLPFPSKAVLDVYSDLIVPE